MGTKTESRHCAGMLRDMPSWFSTTWRSVVRRRRPRPLACSGVEHTWGVSSSQAGASAVAPLIKNPVSTVMLGCHNVHFITVTARTNYSVLNGNVYLMYSIHNNLTNFTFCKMNVMEC